MRSSGDQDLVNCPVPFLPELIVSCDHILQRIVFSDLLGGEVWARSVKHLLALFRRDELIDQVGVHLFCLWEEAPRFENVLSAGEPFDVINTSLHKDPAARSDIPVFIQDLLFCSNMPAVFIEEHISGRTLHLRFLQNVPVSKHQMDVIVGHSLVVMERCGTLDTVL